MICFIFAILNTTQNIAGLLLLLNPEIQDRRQISLLILSKFKRINELLFPFENLRHYVRLD